MIKPAKTHRYPAGRGRCPGLALAPTAFADKHGVGKGARQSYLEVINDPEVEAVYNPLANSLHAIWNTGHCAAGKHVFTEKPSANNSIDADCREGRRGTGSDQFFEGFHYL